MICKLRTGSEENHRPGHGDRRLRDFGHGTHVPIDPTDCPGVGLDGPLITYNGALIRTTDGDTWWHKPVPRPLALEVLEYAEADGWTVQCYLDDKLYVTRIDEGVRHYTDIANVPAQAVKDMRGALDRAGLHEAVRLSAKPTRRCGECGSWSKSLPGG